MCSTKETQPWQDSGEGTALVWLSPSAEHQLEFTKNPNKTLSVFSSGILVTLPQHKGLWDVPCVLHWL